MSDDYILTDAATKSYPSKNIAEWEMNQLIRLDGPNVDMSEIYFWHSSFGHYLGKQYQPYKFEDHHYFSETSQFGTNFRQVKGNAIRAFQENFQQLITLIRQHLIPLLKEVKESHMYKNWFDRITVSDALLHKELEKSSPDSNKLAKLRAERNEAVNHLKDKWMSEVDNGRIWQMHKPQTEQGLDYAMLPQLFLGINLDDPLQRKKTIKEQLDADIYPLDVSFQAKEQVARFMYKFYHWLPTALKDVDMTFKLKVSALKNIYAQTQMYINFMKPLLLEINKKMEGVSNTDIFKNHEELHPNLANLLDASFSNIKLFWINAFAKTSFSPNAKNTLDDIDFTRFGLFVNDWEIISGKHKGKSGFLAGEADPNAKSNIKYVFYPSSKRDISAKEFKEMKHKWRENPLYVFKKDLRKLPIIEQEFRQERRMENFYHREDGQQSPYTRNFINYKATAMNVYDIASYKEMLKVDNLKIMESFIEELVIIREDLLAYVNYFNEDSDPIDEEDFYSILKPKIKDSKAGDSLEEKQKGESILTAPFKGFSELFSPLLRSSSKKSKGKEESPSDDLKRDRQHLVAMIKAVDDADKAYNVFKAVNSLP